MAANIETIKKISIYSAVLGAGLAVLSLIPQIMPVITLFILPFLSAIIIFTVLRFKDKAANILDIKEYSVIGGGIGAISGFSFLIIFTPLVSLVHLIFKNYYAYGINYLNFFVALVFIVTISVIFLITNAGGGLLFGFLAKQLDKFKQQ